MTPAEQAMPELECANHKVFGNKSFRQQQREVIEAVLQVRRLAISGLLRM